MNSIVFYLFAILAICTGNSALAAMPAPNCAAPIDAQIQWVETTPHVHATFSFLIRMHKKYNHGSAEFLKLLSTYDFSQVDEDKCLLQSKQNTEMDQDCLADRTLLSALLKEVCKP